MTEGLVVDTGIRTVRVTGWSAVAFMQVQSSVTPWKAEGAYLTKEEARAIGEKLLEFANQKEQLFYIKLLDKTYGFLNKRTTSEGIDYCVDSKVNTEFYQSKFTQAEINSDPELKKFEAFAIPVEQEDAA